MVTVLILKRGVGFGCRGVGVVELYRAVMGIMIVDEGRRNVRRNWYWPVVSSVGGGADHDVRGLVVRSVCSFQEVCVFRPSRRRVVTVGEYCGIFP